MSEILMVIAALCSTESLDQQRTCQAHLTRCTNIREEVTALPGDFEKALWWCVQQNEHE